MDEIERQKLAFANEVSLLTLTMLCRMVPHLQAHGIIPPEFAEITHGLLLQLEKLEGLSTEHQEWVKQMRNTLGRQAS